MSEIPIMPVPDNEYDTLRWEHTRLRRRMIDGAWRSDLEKRVNQHVGDVRAAGWGALDLAANPLRVTSKELSTLYLAGEPDIPEAQDELKATISRSGLWSSMTRFMAWTIACREYLMRPHVDSDGRIHYRAVPPDLVTAVSDPDRPDTPVSIKELRLREVDVSGRMELQWTYDVLDVSDQRRPVYKVMSADLRNKDLSSQFLSGSMSGGKYPYRKADGTAVLPYVLYHAERLGSRLWDYREGIELVEGALNLGVLRSFWLHVAKDASWPQRYGVNVKPAGAGIADDGLPSSFAAVVVDPSTFLPLELIDPDRPAIVDQFDAGGDPAALLQAVQDYAAWGMSDAGISRSDLLRNSGDPRSGYALSLSNEGKRSAQRRFAPQFAASDTDLVALSAIMLNRATGSSYEEDGYNVVYSSIPLSPEELQSRRTHILELIEAGLMSKSDAYMELHPGLTRKQAEAELARIESEAPEPEPEPTPEPTPEPETQDA